MKTGEFPETYPCTVQDYYEMWEAGRFDGKRVELINGKVFVIPTLDPRAAVSIALTMAALCEVLEEGFFIMSRCPLRLDEYSEPEPYVAVIAGKPRDYKDAHPQTAALVADVEVDNLSPSREEKISVYAKAGITDYWIINLSHRCLEVYRRPQKVYPTPFDYGFAELITLTESEAIKPLAAKSAIAVADLLP